MRFSQISESSSGARAGILETRRGAVETPTFMPVATHAHVRTLTMDEVAETGAGICLANTYHLLLRPGTEVFDQVGGIHPFMKWERGVLTDSGGFQIFSLPGEREITEEGARFRSPFDNQKHMLSPESSISIQKSIGSDIMMVLDVCLPSTSDEIATREAMERTHRWALRSLAEKNANTEGQALFAIVQGGVFPEMRTESAGFLTQHPFDGFAIGGLAVGEARELLYSTTMHTARLLPKDKPRYLMGVGTPIDLVESVNAGIDMFDCTLPGKMGQQGYAFTFEGPIRLQRSEFRLKEEPLDAECPCPVCKKYSRAYLRHLTHGGHSMGGRLLTQHNLWHYATLMKRMRKAIVENRWDAEYRALRAKLTPPKLIRRIPGSAAGDFELVTIKSGARAVRHTGHGEVMHPIGPWEEANRLYVAQINLEAQLKRPDEEPLRILDVGLGAAANAVAALTCAENLGSARARPLEIISLESDLNPLRLALADPEGFPFLQPWKQACESLLENHLWESSSYTWRVIVGDARETLDEAEGNFDVIYFDPFSPESNPTLWTVDFARRIYSKARYQGSFLVTYSAATPTRVMFLLAGFFVGHGLSTGTRQETTIASTRRELIPELLGDRWMKRWERSSARSAHDVPFSEEVERAIRSHPQFAVRIAGLA
ncbi:MAG: tRNA guanosine(34) transglycosylase Tgt [Spirochaetia bacterium]|nr:tRNA guanosine(34) transglycosylase Tgt [Spirochaetia bacterium]